MMNNQDETFQMQAKSQNSLVRSGWMTHAEAEALRVPE